MANASERNRVALEHLKRDAAISEARQAKREANAVLRKPASETSKDQRYRARQKIKHADQVIADAPVIAQAAQWTAYRRTFSPSARNRHNAELFILGFGSMGASGERNRYGGFVASEAQREGRAELERDIHRQSLHTLGLKTGRVYDTNDEFWNAWREQYSDTFL